MTKRCHQLVALLGISSLLFDSVLSSTAASSPSYPKVNTKKQQQEQHQQHQHQQNTHHHHHRGSGDGIYKRLTEETMSSALKDMEYAVRGSVVIAADKINAQLLKSGTTDAAVSSHHHFPFDHIVYTNIGNPHSVGQKPLTWPRQVLALVDLPNEVGVDHPLASQIFPTDAIDRAKQIKAGLGGHGSGAYSHSQGVKLFRDDVAAFIQQRDNGVECDADNIFLTNGASAGISNILTALIADSSWYVKI